MVVVGVRPGRIDVNSYEVRYQILIILSQCKFIDYVNDTGVMPFQR